jgi:hypothetical protein
VHETEVTRENILDAAKLAARKAKGPLSRHDFERLSGISNYHIYRLFPEGGWTEVKRLAGLERHPLHHEEMSDHGLLQEWHRVAREIGRVPTWAIFGSRAKVSPDTVRKRFGGLQGTLQRYKLWLDENEPDSPLLAELPRSKHEIPAPPVGGQLTGGRINETLSGAEFGPPLDFRGLRHAPINEQGVVFLFGMISYELGFIVEAIHASFPDCEAKQAVDRKRQRWKRVRIEFEFVSSNFREHGHDPNGCDLVVCWEHDWQDCPVGVLELRSVLDTLQG